MNAAAVVQEVRRLRVKETVELLGDESFWLELRAIWEDAVTTSARTVFDQGIAAGRTVRPHRRRRKGWRGVVEIMTGRKAADFLDPDPVALDDTAGRVFASYMDHWWGQLETSTREGLRSAIEQAAADGSGTPGVIAAIEPLFGERRAQVIGVTETTRLFGRGAQATYQAAGVRAWVWQSDKDGSVCESCDALDGTEFSMEEEFDPDHPNCRCFPLPVVDESQDEGDGQ